MGRHSSDDRWPFLRSVISYALPWIVIAALVGVAIWTAVGAVGGDSVAVGRASDETGLRAPRSPTQDPDPTPLATPTRPPRSRPKERPTTSKVDLITEGVTVQVLNGTGGVEGAAEDMANRLARLGYEIYAINTGLTTEETKVFWSTEDGKPAAIALASYFGWSVGASPQSLSTEVDIAVVVGADRGQ